MNHAKAAALIVWGRRATMADVHGSPRMAWVRAHASQLIEVAAGFGATDLGVCGSVAQLIDSDDRGIDGRGSDIDFHVGHFDLGEGGLTMKPTRRANHLVGAFRALCPWGVDIYPLPGRFIRSAHPRRHGAPFDQAVDTGRVAPLSSVPRVHT
jgi:hypothetical protein